LILMIVWKSMKLMAITSILNRHWKRHSLIHATATTLSRRRLKRLTPCGEARSHL
jgi:hypothetical protein